VITMLILLYIVIFARSDLGNFTRSRFEKLLRRRFLVSLFNKPLIKKCLLNKGKAGFI